MQKFIVGESNVDIGFDMNKSRKTQKKEVTTSHFVIETGGLSISETNSYGPTSSDSFRTTTTFSFSGTKKVYAAFHGKLLIQPNSANSSLVNLILKPFKQPSSATAIKYIIYRGVNKSSFFNGEQLSGSSSSGTELIRSLWDEFNHFNNQTGNSVSEFSADMIGFPTTSKPQNDLSTSLDHFFFKESVPITISETTPIEEPVNKAFELPMVVRGMEIGLVENELGIDIVLDTGDFYYDDNHLPFNLEFARSAVHTIECETSMTTFEKKNLREECVKFIDYVAFCGSHGNGNGRIYVNNESIPKKTKEEIFQLLIGFHTASRQYIFIQSNRKRSYNFYGNYDHSSSSDFQIGMSEGTLTETNFGTQLWPVYFFDPGTSSDTILHLKLLADYDKTGSLLYVINGSLTNSRYPNKLSDSKLKISDSQITGIDFTNPIKFQLNYSENDDAFISGIISIIYSGVQLNTPPFLANDGHYNHEFKSLLFELFESPTLIPLTNSNEFSIVSSYKKNIAQIPSVENDPIDVIILNQVVLDTGIQLDEENIITGTEQRILFISQLCQNEGSHNCKTLSVPISYGNDILTQKSNILYGNNNALIRYHQIIDDNQQQFQCISFTPSSSIASQYAHLGITVSELTNLKLLIPTDAYNCRFHLEQVFDEILETTKEHSVMKFKLGIAFENSLGELTHVFNTSELFVFGLTINFLSSKNYSTFI